MFKTYTKYFLKTASSPSLFLPILPPQLLSHSLTSYSSLLSSTLSLYQAIHTARRYLTRTLQLSATAKIGHGSHGPLLHMSPLFHGTASNPPSTFDNSPPIRDREREAREGRVGGDRKSNPVDLTLYAVTDSSLNEKMGHSMEDVS